LNASRNNMMSRTRKQLKRYKRWSQMDGSVRIMDDLGSIRELG
jgi:hypothetical protein